jgi:hypothetical protein
VRNKVRQKSGTAGDEKKGGYRIARQSIVFDGKLWSAFMLGAVSTRAARKDDRLAAVLRASSACRTVYLILSEFRIELR